MRNYGYKGTNFQLKLDEVFLMEEHFQMLSGRYGYPIKVPEYRFPSLSVEQFCTGGGIQFKTPTRLAWEEGGPKRLDTLMVR